MKDSIFYILIILFLAAFLYLKWSENENAYGDGFDAGKQSQIQDNVNHGVMTDKGVWINGLKLAVLK